MDSREKLFHDINTYYLSVANGKVPPEQVNELSEVITNHFYEEYSRFEKQYPKSAKRYSTFQLKDLDHPASNDIIIKFFQNKSKENYSENSRQLLQMDQAELAKYEKSRENFYNK